MSKIKTEPKMFDVPGFQWVRRVEEKLEIHQNVLDSHRYQGLPAGARLKLIEDVWMEMLPNRQSEAATIVQLDCNDPAVRKLEKAGFVALAKDLDVAGDE